MYFIPHMLQNFRILIINLIDHVANWKELIMNSGAIIKKKFKNVLPSSLYCSHNIARIITEGSDELK
jgi:hypothetical protein